MIVMFFYDFYTCRYPECITEPQLHKYQYSNDMHPVVNVNIIHDLINIVVVLCKLQQITCRFLVIENIVPYVM